MAQPGIHAVQSLPKFLLPRLSWQGPATSPSVLRSAAALAAQPRSWQPTQTSGMHTQRRPSPQAQRTSRNSAILRNPSLRRAFHATAPRARDHHFDTLKFIQRLQGEGFTEEQAAAMMKVLNDVIEERSVENPQSSVMIRRVTDTKQHTKPHSHHGSSRRCRQGNIYSEG